MDYKQRRRQTIRDFVEFINEKFVEEYGRVDNWDKEFCLFRRNTKTECLLNGMKPHIYNELRDEVINDENFELTWNEVVEAAEDAEWLSSLRFRQSNCVGAKTPRRNPEGFRVNREGFVIVYTDGACLRNGQPGAQAGIGVWFGQDHHLNVSRPLSRRDPATNNVAEIKAATEAISIAKNHDVERLAIHTDSNYLIDSVTNWIYTWLTNGWRKRDGTPLVNKKQYRDLLLAMEGMDIDWVHVKGHSRVEGNDMADKLAREGALQF